MPTLKNKFISIMPCFSACNLTFLFSYINITKLYFTATKTYQASFKIQWDPEHPTHPIPKWTLGNAGLEWWNMVFSTHKVTLTCPNYNKPVNKTEHCSKMVSTSPSIFGMSWGMESRKSEAFRNFLLRPFRQMLDEWLKLGISQFLTYCFHFIIH